MISLHRTFGVSHQGSAPSGPAMPVPRPLPDGGWAAPAAPVLRGVQRGFALQLSLDFGNRPAARVRGQHGR